VRTTNLQCANDNMLFVSADTSSSASSSSGVTPQHSLLQRTCELDAKTLKPRWIGPAAVCACREGFFGADCSNKVKHKARVEKLVGRAGGVVKDDSSGSGVSLPTGALTRDVVVSVSVFTLEDLGAAFPKADAGFTAASNVLELLPHGIRFEADVTVSIRVEESSGKRTSDRLALFFFNDTSTKWHEVAGSQKFSDAMGRPVVAGKTRHFSRWVRAHGRVCGKGWTSVDTCLRLVLVYGRVDVWMCGCADSVCTVRGNLPVTPHALSFTPSPLHPLLTEPPCPTRIPLVSRVSVCARA
jgi:hypothetical protein